MQPFFPLTFLQWAVLREQQGHLRNNFWLLDSLASSEEDSSSSSSSEETNVSAGKEVNYAQSSKRKLKIQSDVLNRKNDCVTEEVPTVTANVTAPVNTPVRGASRFYTCSTVPWVKKAGLFLLTQITVIQDDFIVN